MTDWKSEQTFQCLIWPPQGLDLNPIENVWADMKRHLRNNPQGTKDDLERERFVDIGTLSASRDVVSLSCLPGYASAWLLLEVTLPINGANTDEMNYL